MRKTWFSIFVNGKCVFDGPSTLKDAKGAADFAVQNAESFAKIGRPIDNVQVFQGKSIGRLVYEARP